MSPLRNIWYGQVKNIKDKIETWYHLKHKRFLLSKHNQKHASSGKFELREWCQWEGDDLRRKNIGLHGCKLFSPALFMDLSDYLTRFQQHEKVCTHMDLISVNYKQADIAPRKFCIEIIFGIISLSLFLVQPWLHENSFSRDEMHFPFLMQLSDLTWNIFLCIMGYPATHPPQSYLDHFGKAWKVHYRRQWR